MLALDAASPALLRAWSADGTLPNIARLMAGGLVGDTRTVDGLYVGATWPSFSTALNPAGHGVYWLDQPLGGSYHAHQCTAQELGRRKTLWEVLSDAGRRVMVLDVPLTRKSPGLNGVQLVEWGVHDRIFGFETAPPALRRDVRRIAGRHPVPIVCDAPRRSPAEYRSFADQLIRGAAARSRLTRGLLAREPWDFVMQVFSESHCAGHQLWHFHDAAHPAYVPEVTRTHGDLVREVYMAIDAAIGAIASSLPAGTTVVLLSLHGMSYTAGAGLLLPQILNRLGVMNPPVSSPPSTPGSGRRAVDALKRAYRRLPQQLRQPVYDLREVVGHGLRTRVPPLAFEPATSKCFCIGLGDATSAIRLNIKGRESQGMIAPGREADAFAEQLAAQLLEVVDPDTARPLVQRVIRTADQFRGSYLQELPDLVVEWNQEQPLGTTVAGTGRGARLRGRSARTGLVERINSYCRTGDHRIEGMFVATGPGIRAGKLDRVVSILDLAPSFARFLGCEMNSVDGVPIRELSG